MFFRIKKIEGKEYGYAVENEWLKKGCRQKVKGYLGRVHRFKLTHDIGFLQFNKIENFDAYARNNDKLKIINDVIEWELFRFAISKQEFSIDLKNAIVNNGSRKVALAINNGLMCSITLRNLILFKAEGDEQNDGYRLARACVEAGLKVPNEVFVALFSKICTPKDIGVDNI